jgi:hypothetical protein
MLTQKESHAKPASISLTPRFHRRGPQPGVLCKTNPIPPIVITPTTQKCKTNPISARPTANRQKPFLQNEPNPRPRCHPERRAAERSAAAQSRGTCQNTIAEGDSKQTNPAHDPKYAKRTQFHPGQRPKANSQQPNMRNEPNLPLPQPSPRSNYAKRTQFHPGQRPKANSQQPNMRNEPNPGTHSVPPPHISAKRTQFPTTNIQSTIFTIQSPGPIPAPTRFETKP